MSATQPQSGCKLDQFFKLTERGTNVRREVLAGLTTFLAMVYSVIVVPGMLGQAGFPHTAVFIATCLVAGFGSLLMGLWANLPMAIGCAISLTAFTAFSMVLGQNIPIPVVLGAVFLMGVLFTAISVTGVRSSLPPELAAELESAKKACGLPVAAGFGISTPEMAGDISFHADAVVVGSAMVRTLLDEGADAAVSLIGSIAAGLRR